VEAVQTRGASVDPNKEQKMTHIQKLEIIPIQRKKKKKSETVVYMECA